jgi:hypothetical protein
VVKCAPEEKQERIFYFRLAFARSDFAAGISSSPWLSISYKKQAIYRYDR